MSILLEGFDPAMLISANKRIHWTKRAELSRYWRTVTAEAVRDNETVGYYTNPVRIVAYLRWPTNHRRDGHNYVSTVLKPCIDALVDLDILADDSDDYLTGPDMRRTRPNGPHQIRIHIYEEPI